MDELDRLRRFCINDPRLPEDDGELWRSDLDARTRTLVRLAVLVAIDASEPSMHAAVDDAIATGVTTREVIGLLDGLVPLVGLPRVVAAAPRLAVALGHGQDLSLDMPG